MKRLSCLLALCFQSFAHATFSIIACEPQNGACGAAVATNNLAVGASVLHVRANTGALVSQFETHPLHGEWGLRLLDQGHTVAKVIEILLARDGNFDGGSIEHRQVSIVNVMGETCAFSGEHARHAFYAGQIGGPGMSVQGNGLTDKTVLEAMRTAFNASEGDLAEKLMQALIAGQAAGGQSSGSMSAALLVRTAEGFPFDTDLRVDAHSAPVAELRRLLDLQQARQLMINAQKLAPEHPEKAGRLMVQALKKGRTWDRVLRRGIAVAERLKDPAQVAALREALSALNPAMLAEK